jgi:predicted N-formylglutamate amidohydrolase
MVASLGCQAADVSVPLYHTVKGAGSLLLVSIHEGNYVPPSLHDDQGRPLGIADPADLNRHIAIDHGVREVARLLAASMRAHVYKATHSRLVADVNRFPDETECVAVVADGTDIPINKALDEMGRKARLATYFFPVIDGLKAFVQQVATHNGAEPFVVCMHSFARKLNTKDQPQRHDICVFSYPEFGRLPSVEAFIRVLRQQQPGLVVGYNEPFSARTPGMKTPPGDRRLASPPSFYGVIERNNVQNHFALEICQDLIADEAGQSRMAGVITRALSSTFDFSGNEPRLRDGAGSCRQVWRGTDVHSRRG